METAINGLYPSFVDLVRKQIAAEKGSSLGKEAYFQLHKLVHLRFEGRAGVNEKKVDYFWSRIFPDILTVSPTLAEAHKIIDVASSKKQFKPLKDDKTGFLPFDAPDNAHEVLDIKELKTEDAVRAILEACQLVIDENNNVLCPFHDDSNASLGYFTAKWGDTLLKCFSCGWSGSIIDFIDELEGIDCTSQAINRCFEILDGSEPVISDELELRIVEQGEPKEQLAFKEVCHYEYQNADGSPSFEVVRMEAYQDGEKVKKFLLRYRDVDGVIVDWTAPPDKANKRLLYQMVQVLSSEDIIFCEGEKDVATAQRIFGSAFVATTNPNGANSLTKEHVSNLKGKSVWDIPDNDRAGRERADLMDEYAKGIVNRLFRIQFPDGVKDLTEYVEKFGDVALITLVMSARRIY
jgi:hypothetical protein